MPDTSPNPANDPTNTPGYITAPCVPVNPNPSPNPAPFPVFFSVPIAHSCHARATFQAEGHFVPSNCTGPEVHTLTLSSPDGLQILRVLAPTYSEATALMDSAIRNHIYTSGAAQAQRTYTYEQYQLLVQERGQLADFLHANYQYDISTQHLRSLSTIHLAVHFLRKERLRLRIRLRDWLLRSRNPKTLASDSNSWLPDQWKDS